jgi:hypothetical protein
MAADQNINVSVTVTTDQPVQGVASFNIPLFVGVPKSTFLDRVRWYESVTDVNNDSDLSYAMSQALLAAFAQNPTSARIGAARADADTIMVVDYNISGAGVEDAGKEYTFTIEGVTSTYTTLGTEADAGALATAIAAQLVTDLAALNVTPSASTTHVLITADSAADAFLYDAVENSDKYSLSSPDITSPWAALTLDGELDLILEDNSEWYGFCIQSFEEETNKEAAAWAETAKKLFVAQTSDDVVRDNTAGNLFEDLAALAYVQSAGWWHKRDSEFLSFALTAKTLAADPDETTTIWAYKSLVGITSDSAFLTTTQKNNISGNNGNYYLPFFSSPVTGDGKTFSGEWIDVTITVNWTEARIAESIAQQFINFSNRKSKVPYTDPGITVIDSAMLEVGKLGEEVGHFTDGSFSTSVPLASSVSSTKKQSRRLDATFEAELQGAIQFVTITGNVVTSLG